MHWQAQRACALTIGLADGLNDTGRGLLERRIAFVDPVPREVPDCKRWQTRARRSSMCERRDVAEDQFDVCGSKPGGFVSPTSFVRLSVCVMPTSASTRSYVAPVTCATSHEGAVDLTVSRSSGSLRTSARISSMLRDAWPNPWPEI